MSSITPELAEKLDKIFRLAFDDKDFRDALASDPRKAIDQRSRELGFGSSDIPGNIIDVITSLDEQELNTLSSVRTKLSPVMRPELGNGQLFF